MLKMEIVGEAEKPVIDGAFIARMIDTYGLGLSDYRQMCRKQGIAFSLSGFVRGAIQTGNWTLEQIFQMIVEDLPPGLSEAFVRRMIVRINQIGKN